MTAKAVAKILIEHGWKLDRQKGSHMIFIKNGIICPVPNHRRDLPKGTLANIKRITGVAL